MATRKEVYVAIDGERAFQNQVTPDRPEAKVKSVGDCLTAMRYHLGLADAAWTGQGSDDRALDYIRKIAGLAVHCMEDHGVIPREW